MDAASLLVDTSIFVEHFRKQNKQTSIYYNLVGQYTLFTSTIVEFELFAGATDNGKQNDTQAILKFCTILPFSTDCARQAANVYQSLKQQNQLIDMRDIFIAATALALDLPLVTINTKHFARIQSLRLFSNAS